jgi:hypothetical protein
MRPQGQVRPAHSEDQRWEVAMLQMEPLALPDSATRTHKLSVTSVLN